MKHCFTIMSRHLLAATLALLAQTAWPQTQQAPTATLDNGLLHLQVYLPDAAKGFYRGTRFDWSGVIGDLTFHGHRFYGPWFDQVDPPVRDYVFQGSEARVVAGEASAATGPVEEFQNADGTPLGFSAAAPNGTFVKIGVGTLRRPDAAPYDHYRHYEIVDHGRWQTRTTKHSIIFTQRLIDPASGYGYLYTKTLVLSPGKPILFIRHSLKNLGRLPIDTELYDHNFLTLDHQSPGPDFKVILPFTIHPERPVKEDLGYVEGNTVRYRKQLSGHDIFTVRISGYGPSAKDYDFRVENQKLGVGVHVTGDQPLAHEELWSIHATLAMEPFLHLKVTPGKTIRWSYTYTYYVL